MVLSADRPWPERLAWERRSKGGDLRHSRSSERKEDMTPGFWKDFWIPVDEAQQPWPRHVRGGIREVQYVGGL